MKVGDLKTLLARAEAFLAASDGKAAAEGMRCVHDMLGGDQHKSVDAFVAETLAILPEQVEQLTAKQIADKLETLGSDDAAFAKLFAGLQEKSVTKEKAIEVAAFYIGGESRWKTKPAALKAIRGSYEDRAYQASKMVFVDKSTPW